MTKIARPNRRKVAPSAQLAHERAWQPRGGPNVVAFERLGLSVNQRLLERLEVENAQLRASVADLLLQIQELHDALGHPQSEIRFRLIT
jgi:hypothetical protein